MADLVCRGTAQIERGIGTAGKSRVTNDDAVVCRVVLVINGIFRVAEQTTVGIERDRVDVENAGTAAMELFLHCCLFGGIWGSRFEPIGVQGPGSADDFELEASVGEVII